MTQFTLKQWRHIREMTQEEVSERVGISVSSLYKWENRENIENISIGILLKLCKLYNIKLDQVKIKNAS